MDNLFNSGISIEKMAAFLDGNMSASEMQEVSAVIEGNKMLKKVVEASDSIKSHLLSVDIHLPSELRSLDFEIPSLECNNNEHFPLSEMAALHKDNLCAIQCEAYVLRGLGKDVPEEELVSVATERGWLTRKGVALRNIGNVSEYYGIKVERKLYATLQDIKNAIVEQKIVIVSVDEGELIGDEEKERLEDLLIGGRPDHVVIVKAIENDKVTISDPNTPQFSDTYPLDRFMNAWEDSDNYLILCDSLI